MDDVARYARWTAKPGKGDEVAEHLLDAADELLLEPACELYLVSRQADDPDMIWVTELWTSKEGLDRVIEQMRDSDDVTEVMALVENCELIELDLLGGKAPPR
ncbi:MAG: antibiotic biosynthesis monooxygenase [Solirubrobacterales bacterium]|nr:antibiotic biosynthesis monooxygenase [Solirubrobacterales bacterium]